MNIINKFLNKGQYIEEVTVKNKIVLHHTVSSSFSSAFNWWNQTLDRVGTHFIIDKDGTIYYVVPEDYWIYHIGKGSTSNDNKQSFGIELVNEGPLKLESNSSFSWLDGKAKYNGDVYQHSWRGYMYWASYTKNQIHSLIDLLRYLTDKYNINKEIATSFLYNRDYFNFLGIVSHHNLRSDKTDVSPALNLSWLNKIINNEIQIDSKPIESIKKTEE